MAINYFTENVQLPKKFKKRRTSQWIKHVIQREEKCIGNIVYIFCNDDHIIEINRQYLQHDFYTDIITFDYTIGDKLSGEIYISLETVKTNAEKFHTEYEEELRRVLIHGILHLCGYNDKTKAEQKIMRHKEDLSLDLYKSITPQ
jgi:metalloprotein, YbeY/UPF0054 family